MNGILEVEQKKNAPGKGNSSIENETFVFTRSLVSLDFLVAFVVNCMVNQ